jgi:hypothetical protein
VKDPTEEEEALAEELVTEALRAYEHLIPKDVLEDVHHFLADELVCTSYGREKLRRLANLPRAEAAREIGADHPELKAAREEKA